MRKVADVLYDTSVTLFLLAGLDFFVRHHHFICEEFASYEVFYTQKKPKFLNDKSYT